MLNAPRSVASLVPLALLLACEKPSEQRLVGPSFMTKDWSEWSEPVHLDAPVNSTCQDQTPTLSKDELALYFTSNRRGGLGSDTPDGCQGSFDLWVAQRASRDGPWETAVNLGPQVNTPLSEAGPALAPDGRLLFFYRFATGGQRDIYVTRRDANESEWETAVSLGPDVNTASSEEGPTYLQHEGDGDGTLYFDRGDPPVTTDLYAVRVNKDGETLGPAVVQTGLNSAVEDNHTSVRRDGRELFFNSRRTGGVGGFDIWVATRNNVHDAWSAPVNLGAPVNRAGAEFHPNLSWDGRTLLFISPAGRGGLGFFDIWMTTRTQGEN
ncbi:MAG: hypothetical protein DMD54_08140 [Gemmatimonadetes bacterium]|nr:MAG: hypothetical protein DMD54_08140 [Gemmatimonadota bacterium]